MAAAVLKTPINWQISGAAAEVWAANKIPCNPEARCMITLYQHISIKMLGWILWGINISDMLRLLSSACLQQQKAGEESQLHPPFNSLISALERHTSIKAVYLSGSQDGRPHHSLCWCWSSLHRSDLRRSSVVPLCTPHHWISCSLKTTS